MRNSRRPAGFIAVLVLLALASAGLHALEPEASQALQQRRGAQLQAMGSAQRTQFGQSMATWKALPLAAREDRRARYLAWSQLQEGERLRLRQVAAELAAFPPQRRQALRAQFDLLDDSQRRGWRLGPVLGADYEKLYPLIAYVSAGQRQPLLTALQAMSAQQRADLAVLVQRTPPQERDALRASLLQQDPAQLGAWLQQRLAR